MNALRQNRQTPPADATTSATSKKSTELTDPPVLTDGIEPEFSDWLSRMKKKLKINYDHYPTEEFKLAYAEGRIAGDAAAHIRIRLQEDAIDLYQTVNDLFEHLQSIYEDPNKLFTAKIDFRKLFMKKEQNFHDFHTKFMRQASEAKISPAEWKYELYMKLATDLQKAVISPFNQQSSFQEFAKECAVYDQSLKAIQEREARFSGRSKTSNKETTKPTKTYEATTTTTAMPKPTGNTDWKPRPKYDNTERQQLSRTGRCFICQQSGHMMNDCPQRKNGIHEIEEGQSGNVSP